MTALPLIIEADELEKHLTDNDVLVVDVCKPEEYAEGHIPGAVFLDYADIISSQPPVMGLLPDATYLSQIFGRLGIKPDTHVVAYDSEGGGRAGRLLWTLEAMGHNKVSLLNGGRHAWVNENHPQETEVTEPEPYAFAAKPNPDVIATAEYIMENLDNPWVQVLDARSPGEYEGSDVRAKRAGHIPGAINFNWTDGMDQSNNMRMKPATDIQRQLESKGLKKNSSIVVHCQTHHRSAFSYYMLKSLGYEQVRGYPGSWSDWGNREDTPVEA